MRRPRGRGQGSIACSLCKRGNASTEIVAPSTLAGYAASDMDMFSDMDGAIACKGCPVGFFSHPRRGFIMYPWCRGAQHIGATYTHGRFSMKSRSCCNGRAKNLPLIYGTLGKQPRRFGQQSDGNDICDKLAVPIGMPVWRQVVFAQVKVSKPWRRASADNGGRRQENAHQRKVSCRFGRTTTQRCPCSQLLMNSHAGHARRILYAGGKLHGAP